MINKRLIEQLNQMKKYENSILILEGNLDKVIKEDKKMENAVKGFIISISTNYKIPIIRTKDYSDTASHLITIAKQQSKQKTETTLHSRIPKTKNEQKSYILESFPNIGPVKAKKLLNKFKTISKIINANEEELKDILKKRVKEFKDILNS
jgi:Fanconi anemia group M protein